MAAQKTWEAAGKIRNQASQFMESFKQNPRALLENPALGLDPVKIAEEILYDKIAEEQMSDSEKAMRAKLREYEAKEQAKLLEEQQNEAKAQKERNQQTLNRINEVLEASGLPQTRDNISKTIEYMRKAQDAGITDVSPESVMEYVRNDFTSTQKSYISSFKIEQLIDFLGKDVVDQIRKHNVQQALANRQAAAPKPTQTKPKPKKEPNHVGDLSDWLNRWNNLSCPLWGNNLLWKSSC